MKRSFDAWACGFLLFVGLSSSGASRAQAPPLPLGSWFGQVHYGAENKWLGLRIEQTEKKALVVFLDMPELKFNNLGPFPMKEQGQDYRVALNPFHTFTFRLGSDNKELRGVWSFDGHDLPFEVHPGALPTQGPSQSSMGRVAQPAWTFETGSAIWSSPMVTENTVYFGSSDGIIYALRADSGKALWKFKTGGAVMGAPTLEGRFLYQVSDDGFLYKLERQTGKLVWKFDTHGGTVARDFAGRYDTMASAATVADGVVFIGSADKRLYAVDAQNGREKWHFDTQDIVRSTPAVTAGQIIIGSYDHNVYSIDLRTGALRWKYDTLRDVVSSPVVFKGTAYIGSRCADLFAFDAVTGKIKWKFFYWSSWVESSARIRDGILYIGSSDLQDVFAIDAATGKQIWNFNTDGSPWTTPAVTDKRVYVGAVGAVNYFIAHHGGFFAVDRATGKEVWRYPMTVKAGSDMYGVASSPAVDHGFVFFGGLDGKFYAFRTDD